MFSVVIVAAGSAKRTGLGYNKIFYKIKDKTLIEYSVQPFIDDSDFKEIILVVSKEDLQEVRALFSNPKIKYVIGGSTRQKSVFNGLSLVNEDYVFIQDSARPNIKSIDINIIKDILINEKSVVLYTPAKDSVIRYQDNTIKEYLNREEIGLIQTPQAFKSSLIKKAHSIAINNKTTYTDDASLFMNELNLPVKLIEGSEYNIKATTQFDLKILEELL